MKLNFDMFINWLLILLAFTLGYLAGKLIWKPKKNEQDIKQLLSEAKKP